MAIPFTYNLRSVSNRWVSSIVAVVGIAGAVGVFIAMMSLANGFRASLVSAGSERNATVLRGGATAELESAIALEQARLVGDTAGVARNGHGQPMISPEIVVVTALPKKDTGTDANVQMRGVTAMAPKVHDRFRIVAGRYFKPGVAELVVGLNAAHSVRGMEIGARPRFGGRDWDVVGIFESGGSAFDSEIWLDGNLLAETFQRPIGLYQSITARLESPSSFQAFKAALTSNPALTLQTEPETQYYARQSEALSTMILTLGSMVAIVMGIGAIFGALNTMYSAVSARSREIATLRALGFGQGSVVLSFVVESLLISLGGGLLGCLAALPVNGMAVSTLNFQTFSHMAFAFQVSGPILLFGIAFALLMGLFGGIFPALRAARLPIATALREL